MSSIVTLLTWCLLAIAGGLGAMSRYCLDLAVTRLVRKPGFGIATVNILGCFAMGLCIALLPTPYLFVLGTGFLGGFTTFSTAMVDVYQAYVNREYGRAIMLLLGTFGISIAAAFAGLSLGHLFIA